MRFAYCNLIGTQCTVCGDSDYMYMHPTGQTLSYFVRGTGRKTTPHSLKKFPTNCGLSQEMVRDVTVLLTRTLMGGEGGAGRG